MLIYSKGDLEDFSYSVKNISSLHKFMAYMRNDKYCSGIEDSKTCLSINKDRWRRMALIAKGKFVPDLFFVYEVLSKTNPSFISNQKSFFDIEYDESYYKSGEYLLPYTYTKQFLTFRRMNAYYNCVNSKIYSQTFIIKLGFLGMNKNFFTYNIRRTNYYKCR